MLIWRDIASKKILIAIKICLTKCFFFRDYKASIKCYNTFVNCLGMPKALLFDYMMVGVKKIQQERCQNDAGKKG